MSDYANSTVTYLGQSSIREDLLIAPPNEFLDAGLEKSRDTVIWSVDRKTGVFIISTKNLSHQRYTAIAERVWAGENERYKFSVPALLLAETDHYREPFLQKSFPGECDLKRGESLHFVFADVMSDESGRACFALTREELNDHFDLGGLLDPWE